MEDQGRQDSPRGRLLLTHRKSCLKWPSPRFRATPGSWGGQRRQSRFQTTCPRLEAGYFAAAFCRWIIFWIVACWSGVVAYGKSWERSVGSFPLFAAENAFATGIIVFPISEDKKSVLPEPFGPMTKRVSNTSATGAFCVMIQSPPSFTLGTVFAATMFQRCNMASSTGESNAGCN